MADEYDALEAAASSYAAQADAVPSEKARSSSERDRERERDRDGRERRDRDGRDRERDRDRDYDRDRDRERRHRDREREHRDRDRERERVRGDRDRDRDGGRERRHHRDEDGYDHVDRDHADERDHRVPSRRPRDEYEHPSPRRRHYDDNSELPSRPSGRDYTSPPPRRRRSSPPGRGMRDDPRDYDGPGRPMRGGAPRGRDYDDRYEPRRSPTPEGVKPISERYRPVTKWGVAAPGFEGMSAMQAKMSGAFGAPGAFRGNPAPGYSQPPPGYGVSPETAAANVAQSINASIGATSMTGSISNPLRQSKRLYVGNIGPMCTERDIGEFFNHKMHEQDFAAKMPGEPITHVQLNKEKGYAFIELRTPDEATAAMAFDGIVFQGVPLKVRRPKDYVGPDAPPANVHVPGVVSTTVPDGPNKIYIGGLPTYLNDEQVMELLKSFGELKAFNLVKEGNGQTGASKGFAFCEYVDPAVTEMAIQGLNEFQLGDRTLLVQRAAQGRSAQTSSIVPGQSGAGGLSLARLADELRDDQDYQEILEDINDECSRYGEVEGVRVPRPVKREAKWAPGETAAQQKERFDAMDSEAGVGKVFVKFSSIEGVEKALSAIAGRQFAGRTILCASVPEEEFLGPAPPPPPPPEE